MLLICNEMHCFVHSEWNIGGASVANRFENYNISEISK